MDNTDQAQDEFADTFNGKADEAASGYGINPMQADSDAMAEVFDNPDVEVGQPMSAASVESEPLPDMPDEAQSSQAPAEMETKAAEQPAAMPEFKTFGQAFKYHRQQAMNGGPGAFEWKGKKFTTQLKSEVKAPAKKPSAVAKAAPAKTASKPASESLVQSKGREYTEAWQAAEQSKSYADKQAASKALQVAEDAAASAKDGKSVVFKRDRPNVAADVMKTSTPNATSLEFADAGGKSYFRK